VQHAAAIQFSELITYDAFYYKSTDAQALYDALRAAGANLVAPVQTYRSRRTDAQGRALEGRVFHAFDPDGNLVELLEAPKPVE